MTPRVVKETDGELNEVKVYVNKQRIECDWLGIVAKT
jgi:hypothetical protein